MASSDVTDDANISTDNEEVHRDFFELIKYKLNTPKELPPENYYSTEFKKRGRALIFNHEFFDVELNLEKRAGTNIDCNNLKNIFKSLAFKVKIYKDLQYDEIIETIKKTVKMSHSDADCLAIIVLTHGELNRVYAYDRVYETRILWESFTDHPTLKNKPKLFFIQACQGENLDPGVKMVYSKPENVIINERRDKEERRGETLEDTADAIQYDKLGHDKTDDTLSIYEFFDVPHFLIVHSTVPDYMSWRSRSKGSWFIKFLVECFEQCDKEYDLLTMVTLINLKLSTRFQADVGEYKQVMRIHSTLTKRLLFDEKKQKAKKTCPIL